jgi:N-methylhydantoinase A
MGEENGLQPRFGVDVGGTFTDVVALIDGKMTLAKVRSTVEDQSRGVLAGLVASKVPFTPESELAHGMTVATNALLERRGARTALITTAGFRDVIEIGRQDRPDLYDLTRPRPPALIPRELRFTVRERVSAEGVIDPLDEASLNETIEQIREANVEAVAVCLLFSYLYPEHEHEVGAALRSALPKVRVSLSAEILPEFREFERVSTVAADAYVQPALASYLERLDRRLQEAGGPTPLVMQSSGGVTNVAGAVKRAAGCALSGPAGGVIGAAHVGELSGLGDLLTFDMGGTSTDVSIVVGGEAQVTTENIVAGIPVRFPMVDVHTVSAGGGSIAWTDDGGALRVGPHSAGAEPGPVAYGLGGTEPTVTDADLLLGHLSDRTVLGGSVALDLAAAERTFEEFGSSLGLNAVEAAAGVIAVADAEMTRALRRVSVERGLDPREFTLVAFGGAGPLHALAVAEELGVERVAVPRACGVLSALGLAICDLRRDYVRAFRHRLAELTPDSLETAFAGLEQQARAELPEGRIVRQVDVRYHGQSFELTVAAGDPEVLSERFHAAHEQRYGFRIPDEPLELVSVRVTTVADREVPETAPPTGLSEAPVVSRSVYLGGGWTDVEVLNRQALSPGTKISGPAIVEFPEATSLVRPDWTGEIDAAGTLVLRRTRTKENQHRHAVA